MADTPTHAQRFAAVVVPAAKRAGYYGHGAQARLARDTGMSESSVSRMFKGQAVPDIKFLEPLAAAIHYSAIDLLIESGLVSPQSQQSRHETDQSHVGSSLTPVDAANRLGITDSVGREMFFATIERLKRLESDEDAGDRADDTRGGTAAQM
ncbi:helix-turn-helix transcriptional regulator [Streptomyces sp. NPDC050844]|uniref:helix-turn-helix domain-containing protein n=1 Tax=Streptomyces sp. NPDC050844 TaxID=3155790 RepID=UPI0034019BDC